MIFRVAFLCAACIAATCVKALEMPNGAYLARETSRSGGNYAVPIGRFAGETIPSVVLRGEVTRQAWQIPASPLSPVEIIDLVEAQVQKAGFSVGFDCETTRCGGFDFRFGIDVMEAPEMFVNLRDFHFASLFQGPEGAPEAAITVLASRAQDQLYVQIVTINGNPVEQVPPSTPVARATASVTFEPAASEIDEIMARGSIVLEGLEFETGATELGPGPFQILSDLAEFLSDNPGLRIALVGHTDSVGALQSNIAISKQRAQAVRERLIDTHGIAATRLDAEGMGYLAPRASNLTPSGREANRRVEAIVLSAE